MAVIVAAILQFTGAKVRSKRTMEVRLRERWSICRSFPGAPTWLVAGVERILGLSAAERSELRQKVATYVASEWTWARTVDHLLAAA
jgi:hypothetical protein